MNYKKKSKLNPKLAVRKKNFRMEGNNIQNRKIKETKNTPKVCSLKKSTEMVDHQLDGLGKKREDSNE